MLDREIETVETPVGADTVQDRDAATAAMLNAAPEFDDCARIAAERGVPIKEVQAIATAPGSIRATNDQRDAR